MKPFRAVMSLSRSYRGGIVRVASARTFGKLGCPAAKLPHVNGRRSPQLESETQKLEWRRAVRGVCKLRRTREQNAFTAAMRGGIPVLPPTPASQTRHPSPDVLDPYRTLRRTRQRRRSGARSRPRGDRAAADAARAAPRAAAAVAQVLASRLAVRQECAAGRPD